MTHDDHSPPPARVPPCPDEGRLAAWLAQPDADRPAHLHAHLHACPACRERAARLRDEDAFARRFAHALNPRAPSPSDGQEPPPDVPGYTILSELARGGQGVVYRAVQHETNRPAAIKALLRGALASVRESVRFEREVEIAASLAHPNIAAVFEARHLLDGTPQGRHVLVMELIDGVPISAWARASPPDDLRRRVVLLRDVARAVEYAHARGVIHRDLKPANILVDAAGQPHILDFGLASRGANPRPSHPHTPNRAPARLEASLAGEFRGTPAYAAPEQFDPAAPPQDVRTDIYALGVILIELLAGERPFPGASGNLHELARRKRAPALDDLPAPAARRAARLPADLRAVAARAAAGDRALRYPSAAALAADLNAWLLGHAVSARSGSLYRARKFARRHRLAASALAVVLASLLAVLLLVLDHNRSLSRERARLHDSLRRSTLARAAAHAHADEHLLAESLLWRQLLAEDPASLDALDPARIQDPAARRLVWAFLEVTAHRPCLATRQIDVKSVLTAVRSDSADVLGFDGLLRSFRLPDLSPSRDPLRVWGDLRGRVQTSGQNVLALFEDGVLHTVDLRSGGPLGALPCEPARRIVLGPDNRGRPVHLAVETASHIIVYAVPPLREVFRLPNAPPGSPPPGIGFGPDRLTILGPDGVPRAFSLPDGAPLAPGFAWSRDLPTRLAGEPSSSVQLFISPSGRSVAAGLRRGLILLTGPASPPAPPRGAGEVSSGEGLWAKFSPDESTLGAVANGDSIIRLLDAQSLATVATFPIHNGRIAGGDFTPDGRRFVSLDGAYALRVWPMPGVPGVDWRSNLPGSPAAHHAAFAPDHTLWLALSDGRAVAFPPPWTSPARTIDTPFLPARAAIPARPGPDQDPFITGSTPAPGPGLISPGQDRPALEMPGASTVFTMQLSPDGSRLAAGADSSLIRIWRSDTLALVAERRLLPDGPALGGPRIRLLRWAPDSTTLFAAAAGGLVHLLDPATLESRAVIPAVPGPEPQIRGAFPSPDGATLVTLGDDRLIRLWNLPELTLRSESSSVASDPFAAAFHPAGLVLAVGDRGGGVSIVDVRDGEILASFHGRRPVMALAFTPDGGRLIVGGGDDDAEIWDFTALAAALRGNRAFWHARLSPPAP